MATRPTSVTTPVSDRPVADDKALLPWANKEMIPLARELRGFANQRAVQTGTVDTNTLGLGTLWTQQMPASTVWHVSARVVGVSLSGPTQHYGYTVEACFSSDSSGNPAIVGAQNQISVFESAAAANARLRVTGGRPTLEAQDDGVSPTRWFAQVSILASEEPTS